MEPKQSGKSNFLLSTYPFILFSVISLITFHSSSCAPDSDHFSCDGVNIPISFRCNRELNCVDGSDEKDCIYENICPSEQFMCRSTGLCIPANLKCDGANDCPDHSDEFNCNCTSNTFTCDNGNCIHINWLCDGEPDCSDGSDEINCAIKASTKPKKKIITMPYRDCGSDEYTCKNRKCVPNGQFCDSIDDCGDRSDERNCPRCSKNQFNCGEDFCIPESWRCDKTIDCPSGIDEIDCTQVNCTVDKFKCDNGKCISEGLKCNGHDDCGDRSDEKICTTKECISIYFDCGDHCIPKAWQCDGQTDCRDGRDEFNCSVDENCRPIYRWRCNNGKCVDRGNLCNGDDDCGDRSDEKNCTITRCGFNKFDCGKSCIPSAWRCDQQVDCENGLDEVGCPSIGTS